MFNTIVQNIKLMLSLVLAYGFSVTIAGAIKAWVAKKAGDYTAEHGGFLTLDPLMHIDLIGMIVLLMTGFGWGREVPVNVYNIQRPYRDLKIMATYYAQTIVHILLTTIAIVLVSGIAVIQTKYLGPTAVGATLKIVLQSALGINIFLAMLRFIQSSIDLIFMHFIERNPASVMYIHLASLIVTLVVLLTVGRQIQMFFAHISFALSSLILN